MAKQTGTATDYKNLLSLLQTFINLNGWTTERYTTGTQDELIVRGDGDATDEIFVGIKTYFNAGPGYYNWECRGYTAYSAINDFEDQPGVCPPTYVPLQNITMTYWFWATGRYINMIVKTGSSYQFMGLGFLDQFATDEEWPYPLMIMGSTHDSTTVFNSNSIQYSSSVNPSGSTSTKATGFIRFTDGGWYPIYNFGGGSTESHSYSGVNKAVVWPMCRTRGTFDDPEDSHWSSNTDMRSRFASGSQGGDATNLWFRTENNGGVAVCPLLPATVIMATPQQQIMGEIHNLYWSTFTNSVTAEDTITDGVSLDEFIVFQNIHRTDPWCGIAIKDE